MPKYLESDINYHLNNAVFIGLKIVEQKARRILTQHQNLDEFIMGMGTYFFTDKQGHNWGVDTIPNINSDTFHYNGLKYLLPLWNFIQKYDDYLKLSGNSMRFTAKGKIVKNW